ncbi:MAG: carbohydrate binding family 9 domain-containing protein, partial [Vicinamibacteria bacterium]|nr:carbohydrate binding family 9 domain-containing protein [Vicinamibacteria bacterium]
MGADRSTLMAALLAALPFVGQAVAGEYRSRLPDALIEEQAAPPGSSHLDRPVPLPPPAASGDLPVIDGPPAPVAPETISRDPAGQATMRAVRIARPLDLDGRLDDAFYRTTPAASGFIQQFPREGQLATEPTEVWILFDDDTLYVSGYCHDSQPERAVATELRRDHNNIFQGDNITVVFDTYYDRRNGFFFQTNQLGALRDQAISEGQQLIAWNTAWNVRSATTEGGWTFEMAIPFKSLRYRRPGPQVWGINFRRVVKWKNETSLLTLMPSSYGNAGVSQMQEAGTLVGLDAPGLAKNLEIKPYALSSLTTNQLAAPAFTNDAHAAVGLDVKYGLTSSLTGDLTVNTDFAQVEEDLQQVNLTRFSLQFPEKRDFFLEGQGIFAFGDRARVAAGSDVPILFFSRRIGLSAGQSVPVRIGGRVNGKAGAFDIGLLNIQTGEKESAGAAPTNFSAVRIKRDIFRRSSIGVIATERLETSGGDHSNFAAGADAVLRFTDETTLTGYYARTKTEGRSEDEASYRGRFDYVADRYGLALEHLLVGGGFNPEVGFLRRTDFRRSFAQARFSPRPAKSKVVRKLSFQGSFDRVTSAATGRLENRTLVANLDLELHNSDQAGIDYTHDSEFLPARFTISPGVIVPFGRYTSDKVVGSYTLGQQRK